MRTALFARLGGMLVGITASMSFLSDYACAQSAEQSGLPQTVYRLSMMECEGMGNCANWTFLSSRGWKGYGKWRTGEEAVLDLEVLENGKIVVHRTDVKGVKAGFIATYEGTLSDGQMVGRYTYSYNGDTGSEPWYANLGTTALDLPTVMHFCDVNCTTLRLEDGRYVSRSTDAFIDPNYSDTWTVERFTLESVVFRRSVRGKFHFEVMYKGQMSDDASHLVNAANPFHGEGQPENILLAWGDSLNAVPGSNAERDRIGGLQRMQSPQITAEGIYNGLKIIHVGLQTWNEAYKAYQNWQSSHRH